MEGFANVAKSDCCHANLVPLQVGRVKGSNAYNLHFECESCSLTYKVNTLKRVRLQKDPLDEPDDPGDDGGGGSRKKKRRKLTNGRPEDVVRTIVAMLLAGNNYREYTIFCVNRKMTSVH